MQVECRRSAVKPPPDPRSHELGLERRLCAARASRGFCELADGGGDLEMQAKCR